MEALDARREWSEELKRAIGRVPNADERLQTITDIKTVIADLYCKLGGEALAFTGEEAGGAVAHTMRTSTQEVTTWALAYETFGPDFINPESDPLDYRWWRAILKTDNPAHWLEQARTRQLGAAQIRAEAGVQQKRRPPWLDTGATMERREELLLFYPDCALPDDAPEKARADIRVKLKEA